MKAIVNMKCPNCRGELTKKSEGEFFCEYCGSTFISEAEIEEQKSFSKEKGKLKAQEEANERARQAAKEVQRKKELAEEESAKRKNRAELIGGGALLICMILLGLSKVFAVPVISLIAFGLWVFAGIFAWIEIKEAKQQKRKSGAGIIFVMMVTAAIVEIIIKA